MKYLSVCAGIEAATVAWHPLGWHPVAFSEIERFPNMVLRHHYPEVPNYGDMTDHEQWPEADIDVLVGGTPCQSFSIAGLRKGMADPRGNLALIYLAIAEQYRPRWLVWENVPGVLSSGGGRDFGSIIAAMVELGYCPTWRVLDAQYFGVPQRRRRVFIVASSRDWRCGAKVLLEPQSLRRDPPPSRETGQGVADRVVGSLAESSGHARPGDNIQSVGYLHPEIPEVANPLTARMHKGINTTVDEGQTPIVEYVQDVADSLTANEQKTYTHEGKNNFRTRNVMATAVSIRENQRSEVTEHEIADSLLSSGGGKPGTGYAAIREHMSVRRLTPIECERLQGFPDGYTDIPGASPSARYKALGNSMAVPVMHWIGKRIQEVENEYHEK
jgi:DNA (cytosine-5)-methyltransferase 1